MRSPPRDPLPPGLCAGGNVVNKPGAGSWIVHTSEIINGRPYPKLVPLSVIHTSVTLLDNIPFTSGC